MKRSRRVVLKLMGTAVIGGVSMGFGPQGDWGPARSGERFRQIGQPADSCQITYGGFGGARHRSSFDFPSGGG